MKLNVNPFIGLLPQLIAIAEQYMRELNLPIGTYTAIEIDRILRRYIKNYIKESRQCLHGMKTIKNGREVWKELDLYAGNYFSDNIVTVSSEGLSLRFPLMAVFYILWKVEIYAGVKIKNRHIFSIKPIGNKISEDYIELLPQNTMKKLGQFINKEKRVTKKARGNKNSYSVSIHLKDGLIKFGTNSNENSIIFTPLEYCDIDGMMLQLPPHQIRKLYGQCKINVYSLSGQSYLVFENPDGAIISNYEFIMSNPDCPEKINDIVSKPPTYLKRRLKNSPQIKQLSLF